MKLLLNSLAFGFLSFIIGYVSCIGEGVPANARNTTGHPWLASIQGMRCTGSIISKHTVLTAASCFDKTEKISNIAVRVGSTGEISVHRAITLVKHAHYNVFSGADDLALIKVSPPFEFGFNVNKIELANQFYTIIPDTFANATDMKWSVTNNKLESEVFVSTKLRMVHRRSCNTKIFYEQFCTDTVHDKVCRFNYGSPLVVDSVQVGIRHNGDNCVGIYSKISHYRKWIDTNSRNLELLSI